MRTWSWGMRLLRMSSRKAPAVAGLRCCSMLIDLPIASISRCCGVCTGGGRTPPAAGTPGAACGVGAPDGCAGLDPAGVPPPGPPCCRAGVPSRVSLDLDLWTLCYSTPADTTHSACCSSRSSSIGPCRLLHGGALLLDQVGGVRAGGRVVPVDVGWEVAVAVGVAAVGWRLAHSIIRRLYLLELGEVGSGTRRSLKRGGREVMRKGDLGVTGLLLRLSAYQEATC